VGFGDLSLKRVADLGVTGPTPKNSKIGLSIFFGVLMVSTPKKRSTADQFGLGTARGDGLMCAGRSFSFIAFGICNEAGLLKSS
jgi:hypothetical protein